MLRTHTNGELTTKNIDQTVTLTGWVHRRRDHGGVIFIDLRDRYGITQIITGPIKFSESHQKADQVRHEFVIQIIGMVRHRPEGQENHKMVTGAIEVLIEKFEILKVGFLNYK